MTIPTGDLLADQRIRTVRVLFADIHGVARGKDVPRAAFDAVVQDGVPFCAAVMATDLRHTPVLGPRDGYRDLQAMPDLATLTALPWEPGVAACLADLGAVDGGAAVPDPRGVVRAAARELEALGLRAHVGAELEFFLLESDAVARVGPRRRADALSMVYRVGPQADPGAVVRTLTEQLAQVGMGVVASHHEYMRAQHEIVLGHGDPLDCADRVFRVKTAVKDAAAAQGLLATFLGKPFNDEGGSGLHLHLSLSRDGDQVFSVGSDRTVSPALRWFIGGLLRHAPALTALLNPTINAYRRLQPGSLAPTQANWGWDNRTTFVRIPPQRGAETRVELRAADAAANPYLAVAAVLGAGTHGLRQRIEPPEAAIGDTYARTGDATTALPRTLDAALDALEADRIVCAALGSAVLNPFMAIKRFEVKRHREWVSDWELAEYLPHL